MNADLDRMRAEIIAAHNDLYHPGHNCPDEDEDGVCAARSGKPAVLSWTPAGAVYPSTRP
jgi:hypothetical protein